MIESLRNVRDLKVRPLRAGRLRVALKILWAFSLLYTILWVTVKAKMSSNAPRCCFVDVFEEHLSSMRFLSLRMKLSLDLVGMAD